LGELFAALEGRGLLENTAVVITSDHGESFGAAAAPDHDPTGHGTSLYVEQTKVPLFVVHSGRVPAGPQVERTVSLRSVAATVTHLLGMTDAPFEGPSLVPGGETTTSNPDVAALATLKYNNRDI